MAKLCASDSGFKVELSNGEVALQVEDGGVSGEVNGDDDGLIGR